MKVTKFIDFIAKVCSASSYVVTGLLICAMTLLITADAIGRSVFSAPTMIADSASGYMLVAISFLGLAAVELSEKHITVDILTRKLSERVRVYLEIAILILTIAFVAYFTWLLWGITKLNYIDQVTSTDALHIRAWIPYSMGPLGAGLFTVAVLIVLIRRLKALRKG